MSTTVKKGWLHDKNGEKFAPKTLTSQVQTSDGVLIEDKIQADISAALKENIPTKVSDLDNDVGYITNVTNESIKSALGYTPADSEDVDELKEASIASISGQPGQVLSFDADGNPVPMELLEDITMTETIAGNLFDASIGYIEGYESPAGPIDLETLEVPLDNPTNGLPSAYKLHNELIYLEPNTTYAFSKFVGNTTLFQATTGTKSGYVTPPTSFTEGDNCYLYTTGSSQKGYYLAIQFHNSSPTAYEDMIIVKGDTLPTETTTTIVGKRLNENIKIKAEQVEGLENVIPEGGGSGQIVETKSGTIVTFETKNASTINARIQKDSVTDYSGISLNVIGANLLKTPYYYTYNNWEQGGVAFTVDATTGKIHASGTATESGSIRLFRQTDNFTLPGGVYKLSQIATKNHSEYYWGVFLFDDDTSIGQYTLQNSGENVIDISDYENVTLEVRLFYKSGVTYDDDLYPMLNIGNIALPWEAYVQPTMYQVNSDGTASINTITPYTTVYADDSSYTVSVDIVTSTSDELLDRIEALENDLTTIGSWIGKKWCACGDSITYPYEGITRYYDIAREEYGIEVVTEAVGGSGYYAAGTNALINRIENVPDDADVITILCGINDVAAIAAGNLTLGDVSDATESTFCGCVNSTLNKLFAKNVDANVGIISPIITISGDTYPTEIQESVNSALREICECRSIPFLDMYHGSGMRPDEEAFRNKYYSSDDGLHPNTLGHARIYPRILQFVKTLLQPNVVDFRTSGGDIITELEPLTINGVVYDGTEPVEINISSSGGGSIDIAGASGQVLGFDSDGNLTPIELFEEVDETETIIGNLFDASVGYTEGYTSSAGPINLETLEVPLDNPVVNGSPSAYKLHNALIYLEPNTTYAFSKFTGRLTTFAATTGSRSGYVDSSTGFTEGDNCYLYTTLDRTYGFYIAIHFHSSSSTAYEDMIIVKGDTIDVDKTTVVLGTKLSKDIKISAEQIEGLEDVIPESGGNGGNDATVASSDFDTLYAVARKIQNYQSPTTLTCSLMSDTHYEDDKHNAERCLATARTMGLMESYMKQDFIGNLGDMIPGDVAVETSRKYMAKLAQATNQNAKCPVFYARGNHDDNGWYSGGGMGGTYQTDELMNDVEWYQAIFGISAKDLVIDENRPNGGYGYFDHEASKIRVFVLNTEDLPYIVEDDGSYRYSSYNGHAFSNEQINFVANALYFADKDEPSEWAALFMSHVPLDTTNDDGYRFGIKDALIRGHEYFMAVIGAYRKGSVFSASGSGYNASLGDVSEDFSVSVNVDYTEKGGGDVIAFVSGHTHTDNFSSLVGWEQSLSRGYAYLGLMGSTSFANFIFDRTNNRICSVKFGTSTPDTTEGAAVETPYTGSIESGEWTVNIKQFRPDGTNLYNGLSATYTGGGVSSATKIDKSTLEVDGIANKSGYLISKAVEVKPFTRYAIPTGWNGLILAFGPSGAKSSFITPTAANGYKYFQTGIRQYYVVFDHHTGSYADYANFWIKEMGEGVEYS